MPTDARRNPPCIFGFRSVDRAPALVLARTCAPPFGFCSTRNLPWPPCLHQPSSMRSTPCGGASRTWRPTGRGWWWRRAGVSRSGSPRSTRRSAAPPRRAGCPGGGSPSCSARPAPGSPRSPGRPCAAPSPPGPGWRWWTPPAPWPRATGPSWGRPGGCGWCAPPTRGAPPGAPTCSCGAAPSGSSCSTARRCSRAPWRCASCSSPATPTPPCSSPARAPAPATWAAPCGCASAPSTRARAAIRGGDGALRGSWRCGGWR